MTDATILIKGNNQSGKTTFLKVFEEQLQDATSACPDPFWTTTVKFKTTDLDRYLTPSGDLDQHLTPSDNVILVRLHEQALVGVNIGYARRVVKSADAIIYVIDPCRSVSFDTGRLKDYLDEIQNSNFRKTNRLYFYINRSDHSKRFNATDKARYEKNIKLMYDLKMPYNLIIAANPTTDSGKRRTIESIRHIVDEIFKQKAAAEQPLRLPEPARSRLGDFWNRGLRRRQTHDGASAAAPARVPYHFESLYDAIIKLPFEAYSVDNNNLAAAHQAAVQIRRQQEVLQRSRAAADQVARAAATQEAEAQRRKEAADQQAAAIRTATIPTEDEKNRCHVCLENIKNYMFVPCNHIAACPVCAITIFNTSKICPVCRRRVTKVQRVFFS